MTKARDRFEGWGWPILIAFLALLLAWVAYSQSKKVPEEIWATLGGVGLEIFFLGFIGGFLTNAIQARLRRSEESRTLNDYRLRLLLDVVTAYHRVKAVRRALRAALDEMDERPLDEWQVHEVRTQFGDLNAAQLGMERVGRELMVNLGLFTRHHEIKSSITEIESHLRHITHEWERAALTVVQGRPMRAQDWPKLRGFIARGDTGESTFQAEIGRHEDFLEATIRTDMSRGSRAERPPLTDPVQPPTSPVPTPAGRGPGDA
jgi:hypothetical protein